MRRPRRHVSSSSKRKQVAGFTLVELLVTLAILSVLGSIALPYAEVTVRREKEFELRRGLREVRTAIDTFHEDWLAGRIPRSDRAVSDDGYPKTLDVLVGGVDRGQANGGRRRYLRSIPKDPFSQAAAADPWALLGYQDERDALSWGGKDVYDIHSLSEATAIDGTLYKDW